MGVVIVIIIIVGLVFYFKNKNKNKNPSITTYVPPVGTGFTGGYTGAPVNTGSTGSYTGGYTGGTPPVVVVPPIVTPPVVVVQPPVVVVPPVVVPPVVVTPPASVDLVSSYPSVAALKADIARINPSYAVLLDGVSIHDGFGPPNQYWTHGIGPVDTNKPATPVVVPPVVVPPVVVPPVVTPPVSNQDLQPTYTNAAFLNSDIARLNISSAVMLDSNVIHDGFGPADQYWTWPNGNVSVNKPPTPVVPPVVVSPGSTGSDNLGSQPGDTPTGDPGIVVPIH